LIFFNVLFFFVFFLIFSLVSILVCGKEKWSFLTPKKELKGKFIKMASNKKENEEISN